MDNSVNRKTSRQNRHFWMIQKSSVINMETAKSRTEYLPKRYLKSKKLTSRHIAMLDLLPEKYGSQEEADAVAGKLNAVVEVLES